MTGEPRPSSAGWVLAFLALISGCAAPEPTDRETAEMNSRLEAERVRSLPTFDGRTGLALSWDEVMSRLADSSVIILGEVHDDAVAHQAQLEIVSDVLNRIPGAAVSMEMLDRGEQAVVDDYLAGLIDRERFIEETASTRWRKISRRYLDGEIGREKFSGEILKVGWPDWERNYQPIIDLAKEMRAPVIAANAPWARYTKLVSTQAGYLKLQALSSSQRDLVSWPEEIPTGRYRERFWQFMANRREGEPPAARPAETADDPHSGTFTDDDVLAGFMRQLLYDATMADSIARALDAGVPVVIHLVGRFHGDFEGGTVIELRRRARSARIVTVSFAPEFSTALRENDRDRADVVMYTGAPQSPPGSTN